MMAMPQITLRLPDDVHAALKAAAKDDDRAVANKAISLIRAGLTEARYMGALTLKDGTPVPDQKS